jgi:hypothetical protein
MVDLILAVIIFLALAWVFDIGRIARKNRRIK